MLGHLLCYIVVLCLLLETCLNKVNIPSCARLELIYWYVVLCCVVFGDVLCCVVLCCVVVMFVLCVL